MAPEKSRIWFTIRVILPNGEQSVQLCHGMSTVGQLKQMMLKKKPHCFPTQPQMESGIIARLAIAKHFALVDQDSLLSVLSRWPLFRESNDSNVVPDILLFAKNDMNDKQKISEKKVNEGEPIIAIGTLWRKRKNSSKFKKQFCVIQSYTFFSYDSESDYKKHRPANNAYSLGACQFMVSTASPFTFQIAVEHLCPGKTLVLKAGDCSDFQVWTKALETIGYRYAKCHLIRLVDMLETQFGLDSEGLFRVSGTQLCLQALRMSCERGIVNLETQIDEYSVCGMIKTISRQLNPPLFTHTYYDDFMRLVGTTDRTISVSQKCDRLRDIFSALPPIHTSLCEYFIEFLQRISSRAMNNKMNSYNLGVVFGPNFLRRADQSNDIYSGSQQQDLVAFIIEHRRDIFRPTTFEDFLLHKYDDAAWNDEASRSMSLSSFVNFPQTEAPGSLSSLRFPSPPLGNKNSTNEQERDVESNDTVTDEVPAQVRGLLESDDDTEDVVDICSEMSSIHAEWDDHLNSLSQSLSEVMAKSRDTISNAKPMLAARLACCLETERDWRGKAEKNAKMMLQLLDKINQRSG
uniref:Rho-GAP domain-containing protein n=1 Tax=Spongospora subterranea TaxID=70186 RepID=A0A0H5R6C0_9EUKA|eukprot:CRZ09705.1 hypothetical protein [Spongospora subterranea]